MGQIKNIKLHIVTDIKGTSKMGKFMKSGKVVLVLGGKYWPQSHNREAVRRRDTRSSIRSRSCRGHRQISTQSNKAHGKEEGRKTVEDQDLPQGRQLQSFDAHSIQRRRCAQQKPCEQRHFKGRKQACSCPHGNQTET